MICTKHHRERITETRVRAMDAAEIVEWIHLLEDTALEWEDRVTELEAVLVKAESDWEQERRNFRELQASLEAVLGELTVLVSWIKRGFSAADVATEITAIIEREKALREQENE